MRRLSRPVTVYLTDLEKLDLRDFIKRELEIPFGNENIEPVFQKLYFAITGEKFVPQGDNCVTITVGTGRGS